MGAFIPSGPLPYEPLGGLVLNVKNAAYGAVGKGTTDDTTAIQAALQAATDAGGGTVYVPPGTYKITAPLAIKSNTRLIGAGMKVSVIRGEKGTAGIGYLFVTDPTVDNVNITVEDIGFDRGGANGEHGIHIRRATHVRFTRVAVFGVPSSAGTGAMIFGGFASPGANDACEDVVVQGCHIEDGGNFGVQFGWVNNGAMIGNTAIRCYREVFGVEPGVGATSKNIQIVGNTCLMAGTTAMGSSTGGIIVTGSSGGTVSDVTVDGNTVRCTDTHASDISPGISILGCTRVAVTNNTVADTNGVGINLGTSVYTVIDCIIANNIVLNGNLGANASPDNIGIRTNSTSHTNIIGNRVSGSGFAVGISELNRPANAGNVIANNNLVGCTANLGTTSAGTTSWNNKAFDTVTTFDIAGSLGFFSGVNMTFSTSTGTQLGTATTQKVAFHGSTAVAQRSGAAQAAVTTTASTQTTPFGFTTQAQADALVTLVNELRAALVEKGLIKGSA